MTETSKVLVAMRTRNGMSQVKLAKAVGLTSPQFISNIERSLCLMPAEMIKAISKVLKERPEALVQAHLADYKKRYLEKMEGK